MVSNSNITLSPESCASCRKMIRMRDHMNLVLCTAILDLVSADQKRCEDYEENAVNTEVMFVKGL